MNFAYGLNTANDWLCKAEREVARVRAAQLPLSEASEEDLIDHGINAALTLWHVTDWLASSREPAAVAMRDSQFIGGLRAFQLKITTQSIDLKLCHRLATGSKHFELDKRWLNNALVAASRVSSAPQATPAGVRVLKILDKRGEVHRALDVYEAAFDFWGSFFDTHRLR